MSVRPSPFVLGDLLAQDLGLELLAGGERALGARVAGAHSIEIAQPTTWLERDWIMLTTGVRLRHDARAQRRLVAELQEAGAAALGFGVEVVYRRVPPALLAEARARDFPLFAVPLRTPFRDVVASVNRALLSGEVRTLQRISSLQLSLMDALGDADPREAVLQRLAAYLDAVVLLYAPGGRVLAATGPAPAAQAWEAFSARPALLVEHEVAGWQVVATPVAPFQRRPAAWLAVLRRGGGGAAPARLTKLAVRATAPVLAALERLDDLRRDQQRAVRAGLLTELLAGGTPAGGGDGALAARAAALGLDGATPLRLALLAERPAAGTAGGGGEATSAGTGAQAAELCAWLERLLEASDLPHLAAPRGDRVAVAAPDERGLRPLLEQAAHERPGLIAGLGRRVTTPAGLRDALRDAEIALRRVERAGGRAPAVLSFEQLDVAELMAAEAARAFAPKLDELLEPLRAHPELHETLAAHFAARLDVGRAAAVLRLHHNTVRHRLGRIERLLGHSLRDPATIAALHLALSTRDE